MSDIITQINVQGTDYDIGAEAKNVVFTPGSTGLNAATVQAAIEEIKSCADNSGLVHRYGCKWDKATAQCTRLWDAASITTTTANFGHFGSMNGNKNNPFDLLMPWKGRRLCNISITAYMALTAGDDIRGAITYYEGETGFSFDDENGVWVYTPEFWFIDYEADGYRYFGVADGEVSGYTHVDAYITGRWHGVTETRTISGASKNVFLPKQGLCQNNLSGVTMHQYAKNYGASLEDIYTVCADNMLYIVEYANMNAQAAIGNGYSDLYRQNEADTIQEAATDSTTVKVLKANAAMCVVGARMDLGTSLGGMQVGTRQITAVADDSDATLKVITLNAAVTVTTNTLWSIHCGANLNDSGIGSQSGYIGTNGKANAYYRGKVFHGNYWRYILGAFSQPTTKKLFIATDRAKCDQYDALDTTVHRDTGVTLAGEHGYINALAVVPGLGLGAFCTAIGGSSSAPVGDYHYTGEAVMRVGGGAGNGLGAGPLYADWDASAAGAGWGSAACPVLKKPLGGA